MTGLWHRGGGTGRSPNLHRKQQVTRWNRHQDRNDRNTWLEEEVSEQGSSTWRLGQSAPQAADGKPGAIHREARRNPWHAQGWLGERCPERGGGDAAHTCRTTPFPRQRGGGACEACQWREKAERAAMRPHSYKDRNGFRERGSSEEQQTSHTRRSDNTPPGEQVWEPCSAALKAECVSESPGGFCKPILGEPTPRMSDSLGPSWCQCCRRTHLEEKEP